MIAIAAALAVSLVGAADNYVWPLDLPRIITSSFGEYRGGRFHAGLDLRTGDTGHEVKAPASGYVTRIRCSPWGYGKAVYLKLEDGNTAVFGHLSDFAPALRNYVRAAQHAAQNYTVDLTPDPRQFSVQAGELIARSGDTGIGPAHLHYELRDKDERPFNPRLAGVSWPDQTPPLLLKIAVAPDGPESLVNGNHKPAIVQCTPSADNRYTCRRVRALGRVGIAVDLVDPANDGANKLGVYTLKTYVDDHEIFALRLDAFSYDESRYETVAYHPLLSDEGRFLLQWRWPDNRCGIYPDSTDGWVEVRDKPVEVRIEASDFMGNCASASFVLEPDASEEPAAPAPSAPSAPSKQQGRLTTDCAGTWLVLTALFPDAEPTAPVLEVKGAAGAPAFRRVDDQSFSAAIAPAPGANTLLICAKHDRLAEKPRTIHVFHRGSSGAAAEGDFEINIAPDSPYGVLFMEAAEAYVPSTPAPPRSKMLRLWPAEAPIDAPAQLSAPMPEGAKNPARVSFYHRQGASWKLVPTVQKAGRLIAQIGQWGDYALLEDTRPPVMSALTVGADQERPAITARVSDTGSGIKDVQLTCNGTWLLTAYDPESGRIFWEQDEDLPPPPRTFALTAIDNAGNTTSSKGSNKPAVTR